MDKGYRELCIDAEFKTLIRPLRRDEYSQLEANLVLDGCRDPIIIWNGVIVDGHNRYEICNRLHIPYAVQEIDFDSREDAIVWICNNQLGRRNITEETRKYLIGRQYEAEKIVGFRRNRVGHFELIPIKNLVSNQEYQRNLSLRHVQNAAEHFDLYQINPVKVSCRDGMNYVFNGQHTIEIVALVSGSRDTPVWCMIYDDLNYENEAYVFANQMKYVKPLLPYEIFMANIEAGNDKQLIIRDLVESYDLQISGSAHPGCICAVLLNSSLYGVQ